METYPEPGKHSEARRVQNGQLSLESTQGVEVKRSLSGKALWWKVVLFLLIYIGRAAQLARSQFPNQGLNPVHSRNPTH